MDILWPNLTVLQHIKLMEKINQIPVDADNIIEALRLSEYRNVIAKHLSGGTKRRLSIALAITARPQVLALDEPTTGLGVTTKRYIRESIQALMSHVSLLLVSHDMEIGRAHV